ncbi:MULTISPECIES: hypothetical protein [Pacificibacter]|uniref:hypothetical protein n=1 Tax=Pacificibacter TaxID=1042323 RepID=UPI001C083861|nr:MULTISPECIES: hypothetical protein [Pacificibacter]MBU2936588.1 hypothetical protein [Pacificibacter marinus]MDO6614609.1 hypothetical protein [Pacificibacter sp. 1_MG-2023]
MRHAAAKLGSGLPTVSNEQMRDLIPDLKSHNGYVVDMIEGKPLFWSIGKM